eukprot:COSAG02_NODE_822_length_16778_cov_4.476168_7_plen_210_part_00
MPPLDPSGVWASVAPSGVSSAVHSVVCSARGGELSPRMWSLSITPGGDGSPASLSVVPVSAPATSSPRGCGVRAQSRPTRDSSRSCAACRAACCCAAAACCAICYVYHQLPSTPWYTYIYIGGTPSSFRRLTCKYYVLDRSKTSFSQVLSILHKLLSLIFPRDQTRRRRQPDLRIPRRWANWGWRDGGWWLAAMLVLRCVVECRSRDRA